MYITEYANLAYFDFEVHDFDLDPWSHDINHTLYPSMVCYIKKTNLLYIYMVELWAKNIKSYILMTFDLENV